MTRLRPLLKQIPNFRDIQGVRHVSKTPKIFTSYDSDGKTTVNIMNKAPGIGIMIDSYSQVGFRLNNGMFVVGPMAVFPRTVLSWNVAGDHDINEESLNLFTIIEPRIDLLIVGVGDTSTDRRKIASTLLAFRNKSKINIEILQTEQAASTFNFLNGENRFIAAALIPPTKIQMTDQEAVNERMKRKKLYEEE